MLDEMFGMANEENQKLIEEIEGKDLISDADVIQVEDKNNLFTEK